MKQRDKNIGAVVVLSVLAGMMFSPGGHATTPCPQEFVLEYKTAGEYSVLKLTEYRKEACSYKQEVFLQLTPDLSAPIRFEKDHQTDLIMEYRQKERYIECPDTGGLCIIVDSVAVRPPDHDSSAYELIREIARKPQSALQISDWYN